PARGDGLEERTLIAVDQRVEPRINARSPLCRFPEPKVRICNLGQNSWRRRRNPLIMSLSFLAGFAFRGSVEPAKVDRSAVWVSPPSTVIRNSCAIASPGYR